MKFNHHNLKIELDDAWWIDAGMENFVRKERAYRVDDKEINGKQVFEIKIDEISPVKRSPGVPIFNDCPKTG